MTISEWNLGHDPPPNYDTHHYYYALLARVNGALLLQRDLQTMPDKELSARNYDDRQRNEKLQRFLDAHVPLIQWMQEQPDAAHCSDQELEGSGTLRKLYPRPEPYYSRNDLVQNKYRMTEQHRPSPQQVLAQCFPTRVPDLFCDFNSTIEWLRALSDEHRAALYEHVCKGFPHWSLSKEIVNGADAAVVRAIRDVQKTAQEEMHTATDLKTLEASLKTNAWMQERKNLKGVQAELVRLVHVAAEQKLARALLNTNTWMHEQDTVDPDTSELIRVADGRGEDIQKARLALVEQVKEIVQALNQIIRGSTLSVQWGQAISEALATLVTALQEAMTTWSGGDDDDDDDDDSNNDDSDKEERKLVVRQAIEILKEMPQRIVETPAQVMQKIATEAWEHHERAKEDIEDVKKVVIKVRAAAQTLSGQWWPDHYVMTAMLYRIHWAYELMESDEIPRAVHYQLQLFVDTHLPLAQFFADTVMLTDEQVTSVPEEASHEQKLTPLQRNYPYPTRMFHEGDLPCMTNAYK